MKENKAERGKKNRKRQRIRKWRKHWRSKKTTDWKGNVVKKRSTVRFKKAIIKGFQEAREAENPSARE